MRNGSADGYAVPERTVPGDAVIRPLKQLDRLGCTCIYRFVDPSALTVIFIPSLGAKRKRMSIPMP